MYRDKKTSFELFNLYLDNLEISKKLMDSIIPIVEKFDGKVYNARFDNAIKARLEELEGEIGQRIWTKVFLDLRKFELELHFTERSVKGDSCWEYLPSCYDEDSIRIYSDYSPYGNDENNKIYHDKDSKGDKCYFYIDSNYNNRIKAEAIVKALENHKADLSFKIENLKAEVEHLDEYETKAEELKKAMKELHDSIPYCFTSFFGLETYATYQ